MMKQIFVLLAIFLTAFANECADDPEFLYKNETDKPCTFIGQKPERKEKRCAEIDVQEACPKTCDICEIVEDPTASPSITCVDDDEFLYNGEDGKDCAFIGQKPERKEKRCAEAAVKEACQKTCQTCGDVFTSQPTEIPTSNPSEKSSTFPSSSPSITCVDDDEFLYNGEDGKDCAFIGQKPQRKEIRCALSTVKKACRRTCEQCRLEDTSSPSSFPTMTPSQSSIPSLAPSITCVDDDEFRYNGVEFKSCFWIGKNSNRKEIRCALSTVKKACRRTCEQCRVEDTSSPSTSPTMTPSQSSIPSLAPSITCVDDDEFRYKGDEDKSCVWIGLNSNRMDRLCVEGTVKAACRRTCEQCRVEDTSSPSTSPTMTPSKSSTPSLTPSITCVDDDEFRYKGVEFKSCVWIGLNSNRKDRLCVEATVKAACKRTCELCREEDAPSPSTPPTNKPTSSPTLSSCMDDKDFLLGGNEIKSCIWIGEEESRRRKLCEKASVKRNCAFTCGECCRDSPGFTFVTPSNRRERTCLWIKNQDKQFHCTRDVDDGKKVSDFCPDACNTCNNPIEPTVSPSDSPSDVPSEMQAETFCSNNPSFTFKVKSGTETLNCLSLAYVASASQKKYCLRSNVAKNCPLTCGICCGDDPFFSFKDGEKDCDSLSTVSAVNKEKFCDFKNVKNNCKESCDVCTSSSSPSKFPTSVPSATPTFIDSFSASPSGERCLNNNSFRFDITREDGATERKKCSFLHYVGNGARNKYCNEINGVKRNCPAGCRTCCGNNDIFEFDNGITCLDLNNMDDDEVDDFCLDSDNVYNNCRLSCGAC